MFDTIGLSRTLSAEGSRQNSPILKRLSYPLCDRALQEGIKEIGILNLGRKERK